MAAAAEVEDAVRPFRAFLLTLTLVTPVVSSPAHAVLRVLVVSGLGGEPDYEKRFQQQAEAVAQAAARSGVAKDNVVVISGERARREAVEREFNSLIGKAAKEDQVAVILIGHGSYDGEDYRFNLPGPDMTGREIGAFLNRLPATQQLIVNATSASGSVVESWKRANRIVITATKSGREHNATRFAQYWIEALTSSEADRDKNETVTAAEAYDYAARKVADAFKAEAALATEHSRMEGGNAGAFLVARLGSSAVLPDDAALNAMLTEQAGIEQQIEQVKARKQSLDSKQYYDELEKVLITLAQLDRRIDERKATLLGTSAREPDVVQKR
jgi:hypothetical protein